MGRHKFSARLFEDWDRCPITRASHVLRDSQRTGAHAEAAAVDAPQGRSEPHRIRHEVVVDVMAGGAYKLLTR